MKSICDISLGYRIFILIVGFLFLGGLNYLVFAPFIGRKYGFSEIFLVVVLGILTYFLVKNTKYVYEIKDAYLIIKTPRKKSKFKIPLTDIEKVGKFENILFQFRIGMKYDFLNKILFLCGYSTKGIVLKLKDFENKIVICPKKFDEFYNYLSNVVKAKK